jgi:hypothetical protein
MPQPTSVTRTIHIGRPPDHVLDYLETTLAPEVTVDRETMEASGMVIPGAVLEQGSDAGTIYNLSAGGAEGIWIKIGTSAVGDGTNVTIDVAQIRTSFMQRLGARARVQAYADQLVEVLHDGLGG